MVLRILALHGFGQNAAVFMERRVKELSRKMRAVLELHAIDAPHVLPYDASLRGWWSYSPELWDGRAEAIQALAEGLLQELDFEPVGLAESLELVLAEWRTGGYDGILGFSQGAILAAAVCAELQRLGGSGPQPRFAVLISGFGRPVPRGLEAFPPKEPLSVPSLHMWGLADDHIPSWASESLAAFFDKPQVYVHPGHHIVPQKTADVAVLQGFLAPFAAKAPLGASGPVQRPVANGAAHKAALVEAAQLRPRARGAAAHEGAAEATLTALLDELGGALKYYRFYRGCPWMSPPALAGPSCGNTAGAVSPEAAARRLPESPVTCLPGGYLEEELQPPGVATHERLLALLRRAAVDFAQLGPHEACRTSEDSVRVRLGGGWQGVTLHSGAKAMLLRAAGREDRWLLAVLPADRKLSWKKVRAMQGKATRMATEEEVRTVTGCVPGAVPPFAAAFPMATECLVDAALPPVINFNCGLRTRSMQLSRSDYELVQQPSVVDITEE